MSADRKKAAIIGGGVIGGGWAARFLLNGWDVDVYDPDPEAERKLNAVLTNARRSLPALYDKALPKEGCLRLHSDLAQAVAGADWVQESVPEQLELKHQVYARIQAHAAPDAIIGSSTSGFKPSQLQKGAVAPEQIIVAHPFNPVYLLPLVEVVPSSKTPRSLTEKASAILTSIGMKPLVVRKEIEAHIADRLLEAVWREGLWLIKDEICSTKELDDAIRFGFGLRWAQMGLFETYRIAGGEAGMKHFLAQFGPALAWEWTKLMDVPELNEALVTLIADQSDEQSGHMSIRELERLRDDNLVGILRTLKKSGSGAGGTINTHELSLAPSDTDSFPTTVQRVIPSGWATKAGHIGDARYVEISTKATDCFMDMIGVDAAYVATGQGYFTVDTRVRFLERMCAGDLLRVTTQVMPADDSKLHLVHRFWGSDGQLCATVAAVHQHMDLTARTPSAPPQFIKDAVANYINANPPKKTPDGVDTGANGSSK